MSNRNPEKTLAEVREVFVQMLASMEFAETAIHPMAVDGMTGLAELLGVDVEALPTEGKYLRDAYGKPERTEIERE